MGSRYAPCLSLFDRDTEWTDRPTYMCDMEGEIGVFSCSLSKPYRSLSRESIVGHFPGESRNPLAFLITLRSGRDFESPVALGANFEAFQSMRAGRPLYPVIKTFEAFSLSRLNSTELSLSPPPLPLLFVQAFWVAFAIALQAKLARAPLHVRVPVFHSQAIP